MKWLLVMVALAAVGCRPDTTTGTKRGEIQLQVPGGDAAVQATWDFGEVKVGTSRSVEVVARNSGFDLATISSASFEEAESGAFFVRNVPAKIEVGESATFSVTYSPTSAKAQSARLIVDHDGQSADAVLVLSGTGI